MTAGNNSIGLLLALYLATIAVIDSHSQAYSTIAGQVTDGVTKLPVPDANVYVNNTTQGTSTDSLGRFVLRVVRSESIDLVVSAIGYSTIKMPVDMTEQQVMQFVFRLAPVTMQLQEVVVRSGKSQEAKMWKEHFETFKTVLLGTSLNARQCEIINPEVLSFDMIWYGGTKGVLSAKSTSPLVVVNRALGYTIYVSIEKFESALTYYSVRTSNRFDTLAPANAREKERWRLNRLRTYSGSALQMFRSIRQGRLSEEGFRISRLRPTTAINSILSYDNSSFEKNDSLLFKDIVVDSASHHFRVLEKGLYQVSFVKKIVSPEFRTLKDYPFPVSWLIVKDSALVLSFQGHLLNHDNLQLMGYLDAQRIGDMLPTDYYPKTERIVDFAADATSTVRGMVTDTSGTPLEGVEVFINQGLSTTTTNAWGRYQLADLSPGTYDIGYYEPGMTPITKRVTVPFGETVHQQVILSEHSRGPIKPEGAQDVLLSVFERLLLDKKKLRLGTWRITNPSALQFRLLKNRDIEVSNSTPVTVESSTLGYRWIYYIDETSLTRVKGDYELKITGAVRMEKLTTDRKITRQRWLMNQYDEYAGSINHFISTLTTGRSKDEGFEVYQNLNASKHRRIRFESAKPLLNVLNPDTLLFAGGGLLHLRTPHGLEIHSAQKKNTTRYYKRYRNQVYRFNDNGVSVVVSPNGHVAGGVNLADENPPFLAALPADYRPPYELLGDDGALFMFDEERVARAKSMQEKAYVQIDRPYYYPGDTVWFKVYMAYQRPELRDSLSSVLYVDLVQGSDSVISRRVLKITNGVAWGNLSIPLDMPTGDYFIRAHTKWMLNFGECFWRHIPIIPGGYTIEPLGPTIATPAGPIRTQINFDKSRYAPGQVVSASLSLSDNLKQIIGPSNLSVSVIDYRGASDVEAMPTIYSLNDGFAADSAMILRIKSRIERAITLAGRIIHPTEGNEVLGYMKGDKYPIFASLRNDKFEFVLDFPDTTSILIKVANNSSVFSGIELESDEPLPKQIKHPSIPGYVLRRNNVNSTTPGLPELRTARLLPEVVVKARRISIPNVPETITQRRLGFPTLLYNYTTNPITMDAVRNSNNLVVALLAQVPDFGPTAQLIHATNQTQFLLEGAKQVGYFQKLYTIMLDGVGLPYDQVMSIATPSISQIEIYRSHPGIGDGGLINVISLYTENMVPVPPSFYRYQIRGFDRPAEFKSPLEGTGYPYTVYWNPSITTDETGRGSFTFSLPDLAGDYQVVLEGMTEDGRVFRHVEVLHID